MLSSSREDDLLHKLKNCIGTLQNSNAHFQVSKVVPNNYSTLKENYQQPIINTTKNMSSNINTKNSTLNSYQLPERQPLVPPNHSVSTSHYPPQNTSFQPHTFKMEIPNNHIPPYPEIRQNSKKWQQPKTYQATPRKYEYEGKKMEREERYKGLDLEDKGKNRQQEVRGQISRRYSLMQQQKSSHKYSESTNNIKIAPTRNYQQQVEERKELLESALDRRQRTPTNPKKEYVAPVAGSIRKQINYTSRDPPKSNPSEIIFSSRKPQKPLMIKQNLQRAYEQQKKENPSECSALAKLRKISELNEKINDRIRNIINVFEEHKC